MLKIPPNRTVSVSIDLDHELDYAKVYGIQTFTPTKEYVYEQSLPRILKLLDEFSAKATFFVVGRDLTNKKRLAALKAILAKGHEIANHTYSHHHNFHKLTQEMKAEEVKKTHELVWQKLRYTMVGFRAPGYNIDSDTLQILKRLGYWYDSSVHPTIAHPLLRAALYLKTKQRASLASMGPISVITAPLKPYRCASTSVTQTDLDSPLVEIPITVVPTVRLPLFGTTQLALGTNYFRLVSPLLEKMSFINFEIHGIDLVDSPSEGFSWFTRHPGMQRSAKERTYIYHAILSWFSSRYKFTTLQAIAEIVRQDRFL